jgi:hypothetical protein
MGEREVHANDRQHQRRRTGVPPAAPSRWEALEGPGPFSTDQGARHARHNRERPNHGERNDNLRVNARTNQVPTAGATGASAAGVRAKVVASGDLLAKVFIFGLQWRTGDRCNEPRR